MARNLRLQGSELVIQGGQLQTATGVDLIRQAVECHLKTFRGEWFLDTSIGVPYVENLLGRKPAAAPVRSTIEEELLAVPGVNEVLELNVSHDRPTRTTSITFRVSTDLGEIEGTVADALP